jgi:hypothetical protein
MNTYDVTLTVRVTDPDALIAQARHWLVSKGGRSVAEARREIRVDDYERALRYLVDPELDIEGVEVLDSLCTEV